MQTDLEQEKELDELMRAFMLKWTTRKFENDAQSLYFSRGLIWEFWHDFKQEHKQPEQNNGKGKKST